jgi:hypothetical protein
MKYDNRPSFEELLRTNPKVNPELIISTRAKIEEIRRNGFVSEGCSATIRSPG